MGQPDSDSVVKERVKTKPHRQRRGQPVANTRGFAARFFRDPDGLSRRVTAALAPLTQRLGLDPDAIGAWASAHASEWVAGAGQYTMSAAASVGDAALSFALIAVATYFLLRHGETLVATIPDLLPFERMRSAAYSFGSGMSCTPACTAS